MSTLVYFASGPNRNEYQDLDFDSIYLIDNCFKNRRGDQNNILTNRKVTCIGMDCLESIEFLKSEKVKIDCFVSLNEGLYEGGGRYAINSDMFLGYVMPLLKDKYIHIMNKYYYHNMYHVTMDLPYVMVEINETDCRYLSPFIFSKEDYHKGNAKVFQMSKIFNKTDIDINFKIKFSVIHDSIWNYYDCLDAFAISITDQGQRDFFNKIPKMLDLNKMCFDDILTFCVLNKTEKIGFTPWGRRNYSYFIDKLIEHSEDYPKEIMLFHLNKNDYKGIIGYVSNNQKNE
jgi:hypothetical protein